MRRLKPAELAVVEMLIADADDMIAELTQVLSPSEHPVTEVKIARDWLSAVAKTGMVGVP